MVAQKLDIEKCDNALDLSGFYMDPVPTFEKKSDPDPNLDKNPDPDPN